MDGGEKDDEDEAAARAAVLTAVRRGRLSVLQEGNGRWLGDRAVMLEVASRDGSLLELASEGLRADRDFVLQVARRSGEALQWASEELRADRNVVLEVAKMDGSNALRFASEDLRADREVVLACTRRSADAMKWASEAIRADRELMLELGKVRPEALRSASQELRADKDFMMEVLKCKGHALLFASTALRSDREVVIEAVKEFVPAWQRASPELQADKDLLLLAARFLRPDDVRYVMMDKFREITSCGVSEQDIGAAIAVQGEEAPLVSVALSRLPTNPGPMSDQAMGACFQGEVRLLSGTSFSVSIPDCSSPEGGEADCERPTPPTMNDLAKKIVAVLPEHAEVSNVKRVFLVLESKSDNGLAVSPWDWRRHLTEFVET